MAIRRSLAVFVCVCLFCVMVFTHVAVADSSHARTQFGHDITITPGEQVSEVTCFGCSVHVRGHVATDVTAFGGNVVVEDDGTIGSDVTAFGGNVRLEKSAKVAHDVTVFGGRLQRDPESSIGGDVTNFSGSFWMALIFGLPLLLLAGFVVLIVWLIRLMTRPSVPAPA